MVFGDEIRQLMLEQGTPEEDINNILSGDNSSLINNKIEEIKDEVSHTKGNVVSILSGKTLNDLMVLAREKLEKVGIIELGGFSMLRSWDFIELFKDDEEMLIIAEEFLFIPMPVNSTNKNSHKRRVFSKKFKDFGNRIGLEEKENSYYIDLIKKELKIEGITEEYGFNKYGLNIFTKSSRGKYSLKYGVSRLTGKDLTGRNKLQSPGYSKLGKTLGYKIEHLDYYIEQARIELKNELGIKTKDDLKKFLTRDYKVFLTKIYYVRYILEKNFGVKDIGYFKEKHKSKLCNILFE